MFGQLFREADTENIGVVTGEVAVKFFEKTRLEPRILGEVSLSFETSLLYLEERRVYGFEKYTNLCNLDLANRR